MFGMSLMEMGMIMLIILIIMGPEKLPDVMRLAGKGIREVRKASNVLRDAMMIEDPVARPTPAFANNTTRSAPPGAVSSEPVEDAVLDYRSFVRPVEMNGRQRTSLKEIALSAAGTTESHREVYLHIPYDETQG